MSASHPPATATAIATASPATVAVPVAATTEPLSRGAVWRPGVLARTCREFGYLTVMLLICSLAFAYVIAIFSLAAGLAVTVVGLFVCGALVVGGRGWGWLYRAMARGMLGTSIAPPPRRRRVRGFWKSLGSMLGDAAGWRGLAFAVLAFPLALVSFVTSVTLLAVSLGGVTHWFWYRWLPLQEAADGTAHRGAQFGPDYFIDTPGRQYLLIVGGILVFLLWQKLTLGFAHLFRLLSVHLLGPTRASLRVQHLEQTRGTAVTDADARLRRIERDLHDGTQARLVTVAMQVGDARDLLSTEGTDDPARAEVLGLLDHAHSGLKETLTELREIARGIHPPALDNGLSVALETLAARCPVPVTVDIDLWAKPAPEVETIAYFCVAELLTNVVRHSGATGASVLAETTGEALRLRVRDDGRGGAHPALPSASGGTGLSGLADRVATVDGHLEIDSPAGGPTVVTVHLPLGLTR